MEEQSSPQTLRNGDRAEKIKRKSELEITEEAESAEKNRSP
jgi:hypothetical protein